MSLADKKASLSGRPTKASAPVKVAPLPAPNSLSSTKLTFGVKPKGDIDIKKMINEIKFSKQSRTKRDIHGAIISKDEQAAMMKEFTPYQRVKSQLSFSERQKGLQALRHQEHTLRSTNFNKSKTIRRKRLFLESELGMKGKY